MDLDQRQDLPLPQSLTLVTLQNTRVTSAVAAANSLTAMRLIIEDLDEGAQFYLEFDFLTGTAKHAVRIDRSFGGPVLSLLAGPPSSPSQAYLVPLDQWADSSLYSANFEEFELEDAECDLDFLLESLHIAFMQQEAIRFVNSQTFIENSVEADPHVHGRRVVVDSDGEDFGEESDDEGFDDEQSYDFSSSAHESSTSGGDVRPTRRGKKTKESKRRRRRL